MGVGPWTGAADDKPSRPRRFGGELGMGFVCGTKGMAFAGGERERERARGGGGSVSTTRVQKKLGIAFLGSGIALFCDATGFLCAQSDMIGLRRLRRSIGVGTATSDLG